MILLIQTLSDESNLGFYFPRKIYMGFSYVLPKSGMLYLAIRIRLSPSWYNCACSIC
jgi:hypothetical protein